MSQPSVICRTVFVLSWAFFLCLQPSKAQIDYDGAPEGKNKARVERKNRRLLREAEKYKSDYKDTHLNTDTYQYKAGKAGRKAAKREKATAKKEKKLKFFKNKKE